MENRIITLIRARGISITEASRRSGLSRPTIYSMGRADYDPAMSSIIALSQALGVKPADLFPALG